MKFKSLAESMKEPDYIVTDYAKFEHSDQLLLGFQALDEFVAKNSRFPKPWNSEDADALLNISKQINDSNTEKSKVETIDEKLIKLLSCTSAGSVCPMNGFIGGVVAQEIMKATSGKFCPIKQWMFFDAVECLPQYYDEDVGDEVRIRNQLVTTIAFARKSEFDIS